MNPSPNLFLIGPMGAGKSSIGRRLAREFGMDSIDLDTLIEERSGVRIATIFEIEGEAGFRRRESALLAEASAQNGIVLATGGGAVLDPVNRALLSARGFVLWLTASVAQQLQRTRHDRQRPLLDAPDPRERLEQLAHVRDPIYRALADLPFTSSSGESCAQASRRIAAMLARQWQRVPVREGAA